MHHLCFTRRAAQARLYLYLLLEDKKMLGLPKDYALVRKTEQDSAWALSRIPANKVSKFFVQSLSLSS
jgi:hypothetical protein